MGLQLIKHSDLISVEQVTSGTILLEVNYNDSPVFKDAVDWCDVVEDFAPCPTKPGTYSKFTAVDVMSTLPSVSCFPAAQIQLYTYMHITAPW